MLLTVVLLNYLPIVLNLVLSVTSVLTLSDPSAAQAACRGLWPDVDAVLGAEVPRGLVHAHTPDPEVPREAELHLPPRRSSRKLHKSFILRTFYFLYSVVITCKHFEGWRGQKNNISLYLLQNTTFEGGDF